MNHTSTLIFGCTCDLFCVQLTLDGLDESIFIWFIFVVRPETIVFGMANVFLEFIFFLA